MGRPTATTACRAGDALRWSHSMDLKPVTDTNGGSQDLGASGSFRWMAGCGNKPGAWRPSPGGCRVGLGL